jgi:hypothetical protein
VYVYSFEAFATHFYIQRFRNSETHSNKRSMTNLITRRDKMRDISRTTECSSYILVGSDATVTRNYFTPRSYVQQFLLSITIVPFTAYFHPPNLSNWVLGDSGMTWLFRIADYIESSQKRFIYRSLTAVNEVGNM